VPPRTGATPIDRREIKERPKVLNTRPNTTPKARGNTKSHYLTTQITYWSFLKNPPTIHSNSRNPKILRQRKKPETSQAMPTKALRQHPRAHAAAHTQGPLSGPAL